MDVRSGNVCHLIVCKVYGKLRNAGTIAFQTDSLISYVIHSMLVAFDPKYMHEWQTGDKLDHTKKQL